jgi:hypothetical protein
VEIDTHLSQQIDFWMQQAHEQSQQRLSFRQHYFIVVTAISIYNQLNIRRNRHTYIATICFMDATSTWSYRNED